MQGKVTVVKALPGCPLRNVVGYKLSGRSNMFLKLSCGHELFVAGINYTPTVAYCQQSPCYQFQRSF
jgi:hypothetical protein